MKVLVGIDGSSNSLAAAEFIGRLLAPERDQLILFFATPTLSLDDELDPAIENRARSVVSRAVLEAAVARLPLAWRQQAEQREAAAAPGQALLTAIEEHGADLVVVGFRGTSSFWEEFILGSVSRTVVQSATVPVLVVKSRQPDAKPDQSQVGSVTNGFRVLATYDGLSAAQPMAEALRRFSWPDAAQGWVMTVVEARFPFDLPEWVKNLPRDPDVAAMAAAWDEEHHQKLRKAQSELQQFRDKLPPIFAKPDVIVVEGRPAEQIAAEIRARGIDLVVVGSRGRGRIERLLVGSTAEQVLALAPCSVLIAR
jgi:nucleotide-binding universal stress UspA family protein